METDALRNLRLLLVDDDEIDRETMRRALRRAGSDFEIVEAEDGVEALDILEGTNGQQPLEHPYIVVLDLNMPRLDGYGVLKKMRCDPDLKLTPVFVMSTSDADIDQRRAREYGVAGYIIKQSSRESVDAVAALLQNYREVVALNS